MPNNSATPPFATSTLVRLYLNQGRLDSAERMISELKLRQEPGIEALEHELAKAREAQGGEMGTNHRAPQTGSIQSGDGSTVDFLQSLLARIQSRKRYRS